MSVLPYTGSATIHRKGDRIKRLLDSKDGGLPSVGLAFISYVVIYNTTVNNISDTSAN
jgi:hypothetical protein